MPTEHLNWFLYPTPGLPGKYIYSIEDIPDYENVCGFVYRIENLTTGKFYIGKKILRNTRKKKISQRVKKSTGTRKTYERTTKESDWMNYYGSSAELLADVQKYGKKNFSRTILELCHTKKYLSYSEIKWQMIENVLGRNSYNGNILGRYYRKDIQNNNV